MKVYILIDLDGDIEGVYATREKAANRRAVLKHNWNYGIEEWIVD